VPATFRLAADLGVSDRNTHGDRRQGGHQPQYDPTFLAAVFLRDDGRQRRFGFELLLPCVEHLRAQAIIRRLLAQLRPDPGEQLNRLKRNTQYVVRTEVERMAALQRAAIGEQDYLDWRRRLIAFELNQQTTTEQHGRCRPTRELRSDAERERLREVNNGGACRAFPLTSPVLLLPRWRSMLHPNPRGINMQNG